MNLDVLFGLKVRNKVLSVTVACYIISTLREFILNQLVLYYWS